MNSETFENQNIFQEVRDRLRILALSCRLVRFYLPLPQKSRKASWSGLISFCEFRFFIFPAFLFCDPSSSSSKVSKWWRSPGNKTCDKMVWNSKGKWVIGDSTLEGKEQRRTSGTWGGTILRSKTAFTTEKYHATSDTIMQRFTFQSTFLNHSCAYYRGWMGRLRGTQGTTYVAVTMYAFSI